MDWFLHIRGEVHVLRLIGLRIADECCRLAAIYQPVDFEHTTFCERCYGRCRELYEVTGLRIRPSAVGVDQRAAIAHLPNCFLLGVGEGFGFHVRRWGGLKGDFSLRDCGTRQIPSGF